MILAPSTKTTTLLTTITPTNHPHTLNKTTLGVTRIQKTPTPKNTIIMSTIMTILQKKIPKIVIPPALSTTLNSQKEPNNQHITTTMSSRSIPRNKRASNKLTDKTKSKSKSMIHLSSRNVEWDVAECSIRKVLQNIKKTVRKFFKKRENNSIPSNIELWQMSKSN